MDAGYGERVGVHVARVTEGDPTDVAERRDRFGEEALEFQQSLGQTREAAHALVDYVFGRPVGTPAGELGGTLYTLTALAREAGLSMVDCAEAELARISTPEAVAAIRRKRAGRHGRGALPGIDARSMGASPASAFAAGAGARAAGLGPEACPFQDTPFGAAWRAGWDACDEACA